MDWAVLGCGFAGKFALFWVAVVGKSNPVAHNDKSKIFLYDPSPCNGVITTPLSLLSLRSLLSSLTELGDTGLKKVVDREASRNLRDDFFENARDADCRSFSTP